MKTSFGNQRLKGSKTLLNSAQQHFYANVALIWKKFSCASCLLVRSEILGLVLTTLTADHMYSCHNWVKYQQEVQTQLSSKPVTSSRSFVAFSKSRQKFEHFEKNITLIASIFRKLLILKYVVTWIPENSCFGTPFWKSIC